MIFIKETDTFGHVVVWIIYTSHIDHFTPQRTATVAWIWTTIIRLQYLEVFSPKLYKFLVEKYIFTIFGLEHFKVKMKKKMEIITDIHYIWVKYF